jgi:hypothetical protein
MQKKRRKRKNDTIASGEWLQYGIRRSTLAIRHLTPL